MYQKISNCFKLVSIYYGRLTQMQKNYKIPQSHEIIFETIFRKSTEYHIFRLGKTLYKKISRRNFILNSSWIWTRYLLILGNYCCDKKIHSKSRKFRFPK